MAGSPRDSRWAAARELGARGLVPLAGGPEVSVWRSTTSPLATSATSSDAVVAVVAPARSPMPDAPRPRRTPRSLRRRRAHLRPADGLPCPCSSWRRSTMRAGVVGAGHQLVDHPGRGGARPGHQRRCRRRSRRPGPAARAAMAYSSRSEVTMIRVSLAPRGVELRPHLAGLDEQVARSRAARRRARVRRSRPRRVDGRGHVVGVDEQGRALAEGLDLGGERLPLVVVQERERVGGRAGRRHAVAAPRLQVARWWRSRRCMPRGRRRRPPPRGCGATPSRCTGGPPAAEVIRDAARGDRRCRG